MHVLTVHSSLVLLSLLLRMKLSPPSLSWGGSSNPSPPRREGAGPLLGLDTSRARSIVYLACSLVFSLGVHPGQAQYLSDNPSDATTSLPYTLNAGSEIAMCNAGSTIPDNSLAGNSNTPTTLLPAALCGSFNAVTTVDVWYRIDVPATGDNRFRITVNNGATNPLTNAAMAAYLAPSAAGPFELIDCAVGGSLVNASNPTLEVNTAPAGGKIYIRIWDEAAPISTKNFYLCIQGQLWSDPSRQPIADSPCDVYTTPTPPTILTLGAVATYFNTFARTENFPHDPSCGNYRGGDVWFRVTVPPSGSITVMSRNATATAKRINRMGFTVYTSSASCSDYSRFNEVGCTVATLTGTLTGLLTVSCLEPTTQVWIRAYATIDSQATPSRYGSFQLRVVDAGAGVGTATNNFPCTAETITVGAGPCAPPPAGLGNNQFACYTPGIPAPGCGSLNSNSRDVWYRFVAPANGTVAIRVRGDATSPPAFDPAAALYTAGDGACNAPLTFVECDNKHGEGQDVNIMRSGLVPGQVYYLRVWGEGSGGVQFGIFYVCITSPEPPAGHCYYMLSLTHVASAGSQTIRVAIGSDTTDYTTNGDPSERILVAVPSGVSATFIYYNAGLDPGAFTYAVYRFGEPVPLWTYTGGIAVIGPSPGPTFQYTVTSTCNTIIAAHEDCLGSTTICGPANVNSQTSIVNGMIVDLTVENRGCLGANELRGGSWYVFRAQANGQVSFSIQGTTATTDDLDFAIWDAGVTPMAQLPYVSPSVCSPQGPPIRCSSARIGARTGLLPGLPNRNSEGNGGFSWITPLNVQATHVYLLYIVNTVTGPSDRHFQLQWTQLLDASGSVDNTLLDCMELILPMELLQFDAQRVNDDVLVTWATGFEKESDRFIVERGSDTSDLIPVGSLPGAGWSSVRRDYTFIDEAPMQGQNFYRLRLVDRDGSYAHSEVAVVVFERSDQELLLYPNPVHDVLYITSGKAFEGSMNLLITDATGRIVVNSTRQEQGSFRTSVDISQLAPGVYVLRLAEEGISPGMGTFLKR